MTAHVASSSKCGPLSAPAAIKTESGKQKRQQSYVALLQAASRVFGQARKFPEEIAHGIKRGSKKVPGKVWCQLEEMIPRVQQVLFQTRERVLPGNNACGWQAGQRLRARVGSDSQRQGEQG